MSKQIDNVRQREEYMDFFNFLKMLQFANRKKATL